MRTNNNTDTLSNKSLLIAVLILSVSSLLCLTGLSAEATNGALWSYTLPEAARLEQYSPDVKLFKVLVQFAKNIITLNM